MTVQPAPPLVQPDEIQFALLSVMPAVAALYSVTWMVVPDFPVGNGDCDVVGSALLRGAVAHTVIDSATIAAFRRADMNTR